LKTGSGLHFILCPKEEGKFVLQDKGTVFKREKDGDVAKL
jgi:hypothetical protein